MSLIQHYKDITTIVNGKQRDFYNWKVKSAKSIKVTPLSKIYEKYPYLEELVTAVKPKAKECYKNAGKLSMYNEKIKYIEGDISFMGIPLSHAWNKIDDMYFDITLNNDENIKEYVQIIDLSFNQYIKLLNKYEHWGGFVGEYYVDNVLNESALFESPDEIIVNKKVIKYSNADENAIPFYIALDITGSNDIRQATILDVLFPKPHGYGSSHSYSEGYFNYLTDKLMDNNKDKKIIKHFPGRIFPKQKIITFWLYPSKFQLTEIIKIILNKLEEKNPEEWRMEYCPEDDIEFCDMSNSESNFYKISDFIDLDNLKDNIKGYEEHLKSPIYKKIEDTKGFGSTHPKYQEKRFWERHKPFESKENPFYPTLNENADTIWDKNRENIIAAFNNEDARAFGYYDGIFHIASSSKIWHDGLLGIADRDDFMYPGRLWIDKKLISFWRYPDQKEFLHVAKDIKNAIDVDILSDGWKIEVLHDEFGNFLDGDEFGNFLDDVEPVSAQTSIISTKDYKGSLPRSKGELNKEHELSPMLRKNAKENKGWGAMHPKYQEKEFWKRHKPFENLQNNRFYPRLNESPDGYEDKRFSDKDARAFGYYNNKFYIANTPRQYHYSLTPYFDVDRVKFKWPGRLWLDRKFISLWVYPPKNEFLKLAKDIKTRIGVNILDPEWQIEVVYNENGDIVKNKKGKIANIDNIDGVHDTWRRKTIPTTEYIGSEPQPKEEFDKEHELSPMLRKKTRENKGFGSKHAKYQEKKFWERHKPFESIKSDFYPKLNESPDNVHIDGKTLHYYDNAYAFGYYDKYNLTIQYDLKRKDKRDINKLSFAYSELNETHGDVIGDAFLIRESYLYDVVNVLHDQNLITIFKDNHIYKADGIYGINDKNEIIKSDNTYPFYYILNYNKFMKLYPTLKNKIIYAKDIKMGKALDRVYLKYPGRFWPDEKIITFWTYPSKEEFKKIAQDIKTTFNVNILDDDWQIEVVNKKTANIVDQWYEKEWVTRSGKLIFTKEYIGSESQPKEAFNKAHKSSPRENKGFGSEHSKYQEKRFWERNSPFESLTKPGINESLLSAYYEKKFGVIDRDPTHKDYTLYDIVSYVGTERTPIAKNPKNLTYIDPNVKAIADLNGNLYVCVNYNTTNHGYISNSLIRSGKISAQLYGMKDDYTNSDSLKLHKYNLGIYEDENFLLLDRLSDTLTFKGSDMQIPHKNTNEILNKLKKRFKNFSFIINKIDDDIE